MTEVEHLRAEIARLKAPLSDHEAVMLYRNDTDGSMGRAFAKLMERRSSSKSFAELLDRRDMDGVDL